MPIAGRPRVQYRTAMARRPRSHLRDFWRLLWWAAAFAFCSAQAVGELHLHDVSVPDELCTACSLAPTDLTDGGADPCVSDPDWARIRPTETSRAHAVSHSFEAPHSRAPPPLS